MVRAKNLEEVAELLEKAKGPFEHPDIENCNCLICTILPAIEEAIEDQETAYHAGLDASEYT